MVEMDGRGGSPRVAVLGTGIMGSAMARRLVGANVPTTVWDRSPSATASLVGAGAQVAGSPDAAVQEAAIVITMLPTADVMNEVIFGGKVSEAFVAGAVWAQMGRSALAPPLT